MISGFSPMLPHAMSQHHLPSYGNQHFFFFFQQQGAQQQFIEQQNRIGFLEQKIHRLEADNQMLHQQNNQIRGQYTQSEQKKYFVFPIFSSKRLFMLQC